MDYETEKRLIELVQPHFYLYSKYLIYERDPETARMREEAWTQIAAELKLNKREVKEQWTKTRHSFRKKVVYRIYNNFSTLCPDYYEHLAYLIEHLNIFNKFNIAIYTDKQNNFLFDIYDKKCSFQNFSNIPHYGNIHRNDANSNSALFPSNILNFIQENPESTSHYNLDATKSNYLNNSNQDNSYHKNIQNTSNTDHYCSIQEDLFYLHPNGVNSISSLSFPINSLNVLQGISESTLHCNPDATEVNYLNNSHQADSCHKNVQNISNTDHYSNIQEDQFYPHPNGVNSISSSFPINSLNVLQGISELISNNKLDATESNYLNNPQQAYSGYENDFQNISNTHHSNGIQENCFAHQNFESSNPAITFPSNSLNVIQGDSELGAQYNQVNTEANYLNNPVQVQNQIDPNSFLITDEEILELINN